jgi:arsenical pump membrane protein
VALTFTLIALAACLLAAVARPRGLPEAVVALPLAAILILTGIEPGHAAVDTARDLGPTLAFLALILAFGHLCAQAGVFDYLGARAAATSGGRATRLLLVVVALASVVTALLTLDATVVLLTPVVLRGAQRLRVAPKPHAYACVQLANAGSLLLPISNLTNLLAFTASGLSFPRFALLMALPWLIATVGEWVGLRLFFRAELRGSTTTPDAPPRAPRYALTVLALTVIGFVVASSLHVAPAWAALGGVILLTAPLLRERRTTIVGIGSAASLDFVAFVLALGIIVNAVSRHGVSRVLERIVPDGTSLPALLAIAFIAAAAANLVNNLPATLALTYAGSLATLLWRRLLPEGGRARASEFHRYGLLTVPVILAAATGGLWLVA